MGLYLTDSDILRVNAAMESFGRLPDGGYSSETLAEATSAVAAALDAPHSVAFLPVGAGALAVESGTAPEVARAYAANFKGIREGYPEYDDPLLTSTTARRVQKRGGIFHESALAPRRTIDASPFYNEVLRPNGLSYVMGMGVPLPVGEAALMVAFERADAASFGERGLELLRLLYPTFQLSVQRCIPQTGQTVVPIEGENLLLQPALWFDLDGRLVYVTPAARLLLAADSDRERLRHEAHDLALVMACRTRRDGWVGLVPPARLVRTGAGPYWLRGAISRGVSRDQETVVVELIPPTGERMTEAELQQLYGLTRREVEVAYLLAERKTNAEIAEALYISPHTARHHTERVLEKMSVFSREAVASLIQSPGVSEVLH